MQFAAEKHIALAAVREAAQLCQNVQQQLDYYLKLNKSGLRLTLMGVVPPNADFWNEFVDCRKSLNWKQCLVVCTGS